MTAILPTGKGDITNPNAWMDAVGGAAPPTEFDNLTVQAGIAAPNNGDGRYWWQGNANGLTGGAIAFVGDPAYMTGTGVLIWQIEQAATDGSQPVLQYSQDGGTTWTTVNIGASPTAPQKAILQSGSQDVTLTGKTGFAVQVTSTGGTVNPAALPWKVALAIVRNVSAVVPWDQPDAFDPISYNAEVGDLPNTSTLTALLTSLMYRLGFAAQAANPPPGMTLLLTQFLQDSQKLLYRKYASLHMRRFFRWKLVPGIRFYSLKDNDENVLGNFQLDPLKTIEWVGAQDSRNVWYPLIQGIPPQLYTMITKPWRPARYEIRQAIEVYPVPDQTYWLWVKGHFGLLPFAAGTDVTTIDSQLVYLHALANAKTHYGQPDADKVMAQAMDYLGQLTAGTHGTRSYVPGTIAVPPAVRPTLIQYIDSQNA